MHNANANANAKPLWWDDDHDMGAEPTGESNSIQPVWNAIAIGDEILAGLTDEQRADVLGRLAARWVSGADHLWSLTSTCEALAVDEDMKDAEARAFAP